MSMLTSHFNGEINCKQFESVQLCFCNACIVCWVWNETYFSKPVKWMLIYLKQVLEQKSWEKSKCKKNNPIKFFIAFSIFKTITVITVFTRIYHKVKQCHFFQTGKFVTLFKSLIISHIIDTYSRWKYRSCTWSFVTLSVSSVSFVNSNVATNISIGHPDK